MLYFLEHPTYHNEMAIIPEHLIYCYDIEHKDFYINLVLT